MRQLIYAFLLLCFLPLNALAGALDDATGTWKLDAAKTADPGVAVSSIQVDAQGKTLTLTSSKGPMPIAFVPGAESATSVDLKTEDGTVLRLEMHDKNAMSIGELKENNKVEDRLFFTR